VDTPEFWKKFLSENHGLLKRIVQRRFQGNVETAEKALSYVHDKLVEDNWRRLRLYDPKRGAKPETYFRFVVNKRIDDFLQTIRGRFRLPAWLIKQGNFLLMVVYKHLCLEGMSENDMFEYLKTSAPGHRDPSIIKEAILIIRSKYPNCGEAREKEVLMGDENCHSAERAHAEVPSHYQSPEAQIIGKEGDEYVQSIYDLIMIGPDNELKADLNRPETEKIKEKLRQEFNPSDEERLFLRMVYQDGMNVSAAGQQIGWKFAHGRHRRLLKRLRRIIEDELKRDWAVW